MSPEEVELPLDLRERIDRIVRIWEEDGEGFVNPAELRWGLVLLIQEAMVFQSESDAEVHRRAEAYDELLRGVRALMDAFDVGQRATSDSAIGIGRRILREHGP